MATSSRETAKRQKTAATIESNGIGKRLLKPGVYVPTLVFFEPWTEDLDLVTLKKHVVRLAESGITGITVQGSNGEAAHLSVPERKAVTTATRQALDEAGFRDMPVVVGAGAQSTREAIDLAKDASHAGGDYVLVLPPSYFRPTVPHHSLLRYFTDLADASPLPLLVYNYPGVVGGIDLSANDINKLALHPNIVGCKLTCGNVGKLQRIASVTDAATHTSAGSGFMAMGGLADMTLPTMIAGGSGVITGLGNITPKACAAVFNLYASGKVKEAQKAQEIVATGDWGVIKGGVPGCKSALQTYFGYGGVGRRPLPVPTKAESEAFAQTFKEVVEFENSL